MLDIDEFPLFRKASPKNYLPADNSTGKLKRSLNSQRAKAKGASHKTLEQQRRQKILRSDLGLWLSSHPSYPSAPGAAPLSLILISSCFSSLSVSVSFADCPRAKIYTGQSWTCVGSPLSVVGAVQILDLTIRYYKEKGPLHVLISYSQNYLLELK